jgi:putative zinc finger/helix-turn-helix YgiT family protein
MKTKIHCPDCKTIELTHHVDVEPVSYKGKTLQVCGYEWFDCANCGEEFIPPAQARSNHLKITDAKRTNDNLLTSTQIHDILLSCNLTQKQLSTYISDSENCVQKYISGEVMQSRATNSLMNLIAGGHKELVEAAKQGPLNAGLPPVTPEDLHTNVNLYHQELIECVSGDYIVTMINLRITTTSDKKIDSFSIQPIFGRENQFIPPYQSS